MEVIISARTLIVGGWSHRYSLLTMQQHICLCFETSVTDTRCKLHRGTPPFPVCCWNSTSEAGITSKYSLLAQSNTVVYPLGVLPTSHVPCVNIIVYNRETLLISFSQKRNPSNYVLHLTLFSSLMSCFPAKLCGRQSTVYRTFFSFNLLSPWDLWSLSSNFHKQI